MKEWRNAHNKPRVAPSKTTQPTRKLTPHTLTPDPPQQMLVYMRFEIQPTTLFIIHFTHQKQRKEENKKHTSPLVSHSSWVIWVNYNRRAQIGYFSWLNTYIWVVCG